MHWTAVRHQPQEVLERAEKLELSYFWLQYCTGYIGSVVIMTGDTWFGLGFRFDGHKTSLVSQDWQWQSLQEHITHIKQKGLGSFSEFHCMPFFLSVSFSPPTSPTCAFKIGLLIPDSDTTITIAWSIWATCYHYIVSSWEWKPSAQSWEFQSKTKNLTLWMCPFQCHSTNESCRFLGNKQSIRPMFMLKQHFNICGIFRVWHWNLKRVLNIFHSVLLSRIIVDVFRCLSIFPKFNLWLWLVGHWKFEGIMKKWAAKCYQK